ncbi:hypothetical protein AHOG_20840 [Actinoalloteichus hoggarensis]|uniref:Uncharacterized protein n=1 Tax=Actinoalloteichus hoggarensis TaxID=1470176 RepID=A0A221W7D3_9PSEU|nr:hypothetical protein AHOG_20840 [Actinoalloteichus hoggarensis]
MNRGDWPVVVTDRCAHSCAEAMGFADPTEARAWLHEQIRVRGTVTDRLPASVAGRRSRSGYFVVIEDEVLLPLAEDRDGAPQWIATYCVLFPGRRAAAVTPSSLRGRRLLDEVELLPHAVERFQQYCGGSADPALARRELYDVLAPTVRATSRPPRWSGTRPADFYLVAGDDGEYVLPCRVGGGRRPFDATTCIHRSRDLFDLEGDRLLARCLLGADTVPARSAGRACIERGGASGARLVWHRPAWAPARPAARWWLVLAPRLAIPVAWQPRHRSRPLIALGLVDRRPVLVRLLERLRRLRRRSSASWRPRPTGGAAGRAYRARRR